MQHLFRLAALTFLAVASGATAAPEIEATFGDWSRVCVPESDDTGDKNQGATKRTCQIVQTASQDGRRILQTTIGYIAGSDKPIMTLTAPLGIYLPRGITLSINDTPTTAAIQRCDENGCLAFIAMEKSLIDSMVKFDKGSVIVATSPQKNVKLPFSLDGFKKAFASLEPIGGEKQ